MKTIMALFIKYRYILLVLFFAFIAAFPLLHVGLIPTHDGEYHLIRFYEFDKMLRLGYVFPRWAPDLNYSYGIPLFTYIYPLPNYFSSFLHIFGISFLDGVKLNMFFATLVGALLCYAWIKRFWGNMGGLVSSVCYTFAPYHFVDIYVRGSVGEVWALALFPGFLWTYDNFLDNSKPLYGVLAAIFLALTIFSHNILGLMFFSFAICYCIFSLFTRKILKAKLFATLLIFAGSLGLSSIFWIPALFETQYVTGLQIYNVTQNFPELFQLLFPSWGTGFFDNNLSNQMSVQIGFANLFIVACSFFLFWKLWKKKANNKIVVGFFITVFFILTMLMLPYSLSIWQTVPLIHYFQFPWRILSLIILLCAFLSGGIIQLKKPVLFGLLLILLIVMTTYSYTQPAYYMIRDDKYYVSRSNFIDGTNSPGNSFNTIWNASAVTHPKELFPSQKNIIITNQHFLNPTNFIENVNIQNAGSQSIAVSYFPDWKVTMDNSFINTYPNKQGLLTFNLPKGKHVVHIVIGETLLESISSYLSLLTLLVLTIVALRKRK